MVRRSTPFAEGERAMRPHVSVIVPSFNRRRMLTEALASVLGQRGVRFELIVVDDGSTDGSFEASRALLDEAFARRRNDPAGGSTDGLCSARLERIPRRGVGAARNHGASLADGEFLAFLDSDDLWAPLKLSRQLDFMRSCRRYPLTQTEELWIRAGRRINPSLRHRKRAGDIFVDSLRTCLISPSAVMISRELFFAFEGFDPRFSACEDYDLWLRILTRHEPGLLGEPLVTRRAGHPDQLSAMTVALDRFRVITLTKLLADPRLTGSRREAVADVLAEKCRILAGGLARRARAWQAELYVQAAALAEEAWRLGHLRELARLAAALTDCGLAASNFTAPTNSARAPKRPADLGTPGCAGHGRRVAAHGAPPPAPIANDPRCRVDELQSVSLPSLM